MARVFLSLSLFSPTTIVSKNRARESITLAQNGVTRNWREFLFFQPVCPTFANTHERKTAARKPEGEEEGGRLAVCWLANRHSGCFSVRMEGVGIDSRCFEGLGDGENEFEESKKGINVDCWNCFWEIGSRLWGNNCKWFLNEWQWKMMAIKRDRWRKSKKFWNSVEIVL